MTVLFLTFWSSYFIPLFPALIPLVRISSKTVRKQASLSCTWSEGKGGRQNKSPGDVHVLISRTCEHVAWQRGIKVADEIQVVYQQTLTQGKYLDDLGEPNIITRVPQRAREAEELVSERFQEKRIQPTVAGFEDGRGLQAKEPRNVWGF